MHPLAATALATTTLLGILAFWRYVFPKAYVMKKGQCYQYSSSQAGRENFHDNEELPITRIVESLEGGTWHNLFRWNGETGAWVPPRLWRAQGTMNAVPCP